VFELAEAATVPAVKSCCAGTGVAAVSEAIAPPPAWRIAVGNLAAGAVAGCFVEAALYPLDTIKTRLQLMRKGGGLQALLNSGGGRGLYAGIK